MLGGEIGNACFFYQGEGFFVLAYDVLAIFAVDGGKKVVVLVVGLLNTYIGNGMSVYSRLWHAGFFFPFSPCLQVVDDSCLNPSSTFF